MCGKIFLMATDSKTTPPEFIAWIDARLEEAGLSDSDASQRAGLSRIGIYEIRSGLRPGLKKCLALADLFGYPADHVLRLAGHLPPKPRDTDLDPDVQFRLQEVARKLTLLSPEERDRLTRQYLTQIDFALALKGIDEEETEEQREDVESGRG